MFNGCSSLKNLYFNFNTSLVEDMGKMFYGCSSFKNLYLNFNTSLVTNMGSMFYDCILLQSLNLSNFDTTNVEDMSSMFKGCISLKYLIISNFNFSKICSEMFYKLSSLRYIDIYNTKNRGGGGDSFNNEFQRLNSYSYLIVCQNGDFITNENYLYDCCDIINDILFCPKITIATTSPILFSSMIDTSSFFTKEYSTNKIIETTDFIDTSIPKNKESESIASSLLENKSIKSTFVNFIDESTNIFHIYNNTSSGINENIMTTTESSLKQFLTIVESKESTSYIESEKSTYKLESDESTSKMEENELTSLLEHIESSSKLELNETTYTSRFEIESDEITSKTDLEESSSKSEFNESTSQLKQKEITTNIKSEESTSKIEEDKSTNQIRARAKNFEYRN